MLKDCFKLKTLGILSSITGWLLMIGAGIAALIMLFSIFSGTATPATMFALIFGVPLYFLIGISQLGVRVLTDKALDEKVSK